MKSHYERLKEIIAQLDEINTRLDLIEECLGEQVGPWPTQLMEVPTQKHTWTFRLPLPPGSTGNPYDLLKNVVIHDELEESGTHPPDCRCAWCEPPEGFIEQWRVDY